MDTKKNVWGGRLRQHSWSVPVLDETECLLSLLGNQPLEPGPTAVSSAGSPTTAPDGTVVKLRLYRFVHSGQVREGSEMPFIVIEDVIADGGAVLIKRGASSRGLITSLTQRTTYSRDARFRFQADTVDAVDGQRIKLRNSEQGAGKPQRPSVSLQVPLAGLWLKGDEKGIRAGMVVVGYVDGAQQIRVTR
jgi:hypothetical protein